MSRELADRKTRIETPRLLLDEFLKEDFEGLSDLFASLLRAGQHWYNARADKPETVREFFDLILANQQDLPRRTYRLAVRQRTSSRVIGYVALCDIHGDREGKPDTGILIDPDFQRGGFGREARVAINVLALRLGLPTLFCDIAANNLGSMNNATSMGYKPVCQNGLPLTFQQNTVRGSEVWRRFRISRNDIIATTPRLLHDLAGRYWPGGVSVETAITISSPDLQTRVCQTHAAGDSSIMLSRRPSSSAATATAIG